MQAQCEKPPRWWNYGAGSLLWVTAAIALAGLLVFLTLWVAPLVIPAPAEPVTPDRGAAMYADDALGLLALVGVTIGALAALLRALAHRRSNNLDHTGKLLAVTAFAFAFWAAALRIPETFEYLRPAVLWIAGSTLAIMILIAGVRELLRRRRRRLRRA